MDERDFFDEKESKKPHTLTCPHCRQAGEYELSWLVRTKKKQLSRRGPARRPDQDVAAEALARPLLMGRLPDTGGMEVEHFIAAGNKRGKALCCSP